MLLMCMCPMPEMNSYNFHMIAIWAIIFPNWLQAILTQEGSYLKSKGKASNATRIAVLTWRSLLVVSREWKFYWLRLVLYMLLTLCVGTVFSGLGHSLSSVVVSFVISDQTPCFPYNSENVTCSCQPGSLSLIST